MVYEDIITPIQDVYHNSSLNIDHICIFCSEIYVFHRSDSQPGLISKTWKRYLVGYNVQNQYRIYDPVCNTIYIRKNVWFNEQNVGLPKPVIIYDNSYQDKNVGNTTQLFPLL